MKLIVLGLILYLYYQFFYKRSTLSSGTDDIKIESSDDHDDDYVDYEEVD